jgi:PST family polysaccharide transporter
LISQLNYLTSLLGTIAVFGMWNGCIKLLAEARARGDSEQEATVRSITLFYPLLAGVAFTAVAVATSNGLSRVLYGSDAHRWAVVVAAFAVPASLSGSAVGVGLQGHGRMQRLALGNALSFVAGTAVVIALVSGFGVNGGVAAVPLAAFAGAAIFWTIHPGFFKGIRVTKRALLDRSALRAVYAFGVAAVVLSVASSLTDIAVRTLIVRKIGITANGLYQPVAMLSNQLFLALIAALATYLFPRLTSLYATGRDEEAVAEVNLGLRTMLLITIPGVLVAVTFAPQLIRLVYSDDFTSASSALSWQMSGEVCRVLAWTVGAVLLPRGLLRAWLAIGLLTLVTQAVVAVTLVGRFGLVGIAVAHTASWVVNALLAVVVARRAASFRLERSTAVLVAAATVFTIAALAGAVTGGRAAEAVGLVLLVSWMAFALRPVRAALAAVRGARA